MRRKKKVVGEDFATSFAGSDLHSKALSHGDVFSGKLADDALAKIGARAMTMDGEIIVNSNFNLSEAEDQAEYAHELYHQYKNTAVGANLRDAEEITARAIESMVFHRASGGKGDALPGNIQTLFTEAEQTVTPTTNNADNNRSSTGNKEVDPEPSAAQGYAALRRQGLSHQEVIDLLTQMLLKKHDQAHQDQLNRGGHFKGFAQ